jgi:hypothetical protein
MRAVSLQPLGVGRVLTNGTKGTFMCAIGKVADVTASKLGAARTNVRANVRQVPGPCAH